MDFQTNHTRCARRREPENIGKIGIKSEQNSTALDRKLSYIAIRFARQAHLDHSNCVVSLLNERYSVSDGKVLVKKKLREASTISLLARPAAYFSAARTWSQLSCGYASRVCYVVSPAHSFSRIK